MCFFYCLKCKKVCKNDSYDNILHMSCLIFCCAIRFVTASEIQFTFDSDRIFVHISIHESVFILPFIELHRIYLRLSCTIPKRLFAFLCCVFYFKALVSLANSFQLLLIFFAGKIGLLEIYTLEHYKFLNSFIYLFIHSKISL